MEFILIIAILNEVRWNGKGVLIYFSLIAKAVETFFS